jgi:hypothetical protein
VSERVLADCLAHGELVLKRYELPRKDTRVREREIVEHMRNAGIVPRLVARTVGPNFRFRLTPRSESWRFGGARWRDANLRPPGSQPTRTDGSEVSPQWLCGLVAGQLS